MTDLPAFDEVHVVSDLHMGGQRGFQILRETARLANFVLRLAHQRTEGRLALVLNGDVFDSLAEDFSGYVAIDDARDVVERIVADPSFAPVWDAFATFVHAAGRTLVFVIGNHDIEIAFPPVQRFILQRLAGDDLAARARIEFSTTGAGFACMVGGSRVFCIHGNEVDAWNYNRYEDLSRVSRRLNAGESMAQDEWQPNAGTRMVKEVMNAVKRRYAWIDLLKPETSAAVGTLLVLDPSKAGRIAALSGIVAERKRGGAERDARLSSDVVHELAPAASRPSVERLLGPNVRRNIAATDRAKAMLLAAEIDEPLETRDDDGTLGTSQLVVDRLTGWMRGVSKAEALRRALRDWLEKDKTFDPDAPDDTFTLVGERVGPAVDFLVTGHTHLERALPMGGGRYYFNSGTWIRLLRVTPSMTADEKSFDAVFAVLTDGTMKAIDEAVFNGEPFVMDQTSAVSIGHDGNEVIGSLVHVVGDGSGEPQVVRRFARAAQ